MITSYLEQCGHTATAHSDTQRQPGAGSNKPAATHDTDDIVLVLCKLGLPYHSVLFNHTTQVSATASTQQPPHLLQPPLGITKYMYASYIML